MKKVTQTESNLFCLVRIALETQSPKPVSGTDWAEAVEIATKQGIVGVVLDGINRCFEANVPVDMDFKTKMEWIGLVRQMEAGYKHHQNTIYKLAQFYAKHDIKMIVLKGIGLSLNYPVPSHRPAGDMDIYLFGKQKCADRLISEELKIKVDSGHHHHTVFFFQGESIENHYDFLNVHVRKSNKRIEKKLKDLCAFVSEKRPEGYYLPSTEFNAIFVLRHCASHFASTSMSVRQILDWGLFMQRHHKEINWDEYIPYLKNEGMYRFYNLIGLFCVTHFGFDASIFHGINSDAIFDRFTKEVLSPEFKDKENGSLLRSLSVKPRRWWHNRWKNRLCYPDSAWSEFAYGLWAKVLKPSHFIQ